MKVYVKITIVDDKGRIISIHDHDYTIRTSDGNYTIKKMLEEGTIFSNI
jgi:hypothetical protein